MLLLLRMASITGFEDNALQPRELYWIFPSWTRAFSISFCLPLRLFGTYTPVTTNSSPLPKELTLGKPLPLDLERRARLRTRGYVQLRVPVKCRDPDLRPEHRLDRVDPGVHVEVAIPAPVYRVLGDVDHHVEVARRGAMLTRLALSPEAERVTVVDARRVSVSVSSSSSSPVPLPLHSLQGLLDYDPASLALVARLHPDEPGEPGALDPLDLASASALRASSSAMFLGLRRSLRRPGRPPSGVCLSPWPSQL